VKSRIFECLQCKINLAEKLIELLHAFVRVPLALKLRQVFSDFVAVDAAVSQAAEIIRSAL
jgi:hypothetical protein